jgi:adenylyltransferase/sulfurtransferase
MMQEINVFELQKLREEKVDFQLLDVRESYEYEIANLGGDLIPIGSIVEKMESISTEKQVIVICRSGMRSANVVDYLTKVTGKKNFYNLKGGILAWADHIDPTMQKY